MLMFFSSYRIYRSSFSERSDTTSSNVKSRIFPFFSRFFYRRRESTSTEKNVLVLRFVPLRSHVLFISSSHLLSCCKEIMNDLIQYQPLQRL